MTLSLLQEAVQSYENSDGKPLNGGELYTYSAGTLTPKATYQDSAGSTPNANPIVLNARGEATVYGSGNYRFILKDASGATVYDRDNIASVPIAGDLSGSTGASMIGFDGTTLDLQIKNRINRVVDSIAALRALDKTKYTKAFVTGYYAATDGGGGAYQYDSTDTTSADNSGTIIVATDGGRWKLQNTGVLSVRQFGAKGDGTTNDSAAFQACIDAVDPNGDIYVPEGTFILNTALSIAGVSGADSGLTIRGNGLGSAIRPGASITSIFNVAGKNVRIEGLFFWNQSSNATSGLLITTSTADAGYSARITKNYFVGFTNGISASGQNYDIHDNWFQDNTNDIKFTNDGRNSSIHGNYMLGGNTGIALEKTTQQAEGMRIFNNTLLKTLGSGAGISMVAGLDIFIGHNVIDQTGASSPGIYMPAGANTIAKVKIIGNWIAAGENSYSIFTSGNNNDIHISGNSIMSNNGLVATAGISLASTNGYQVIGNNFGIVTGSDLSTSGASNATVFGNTSSQGSSSTAISNVVSQTLAGPKFILSTGNIPTLTAGNGAPAAVEPASSLYLRSDGGIGGHLYVSNGGGTWNPVPGV